MQTPYKCAHQVSANTWNSVVSRTLQVQGNQVQLTDVAVEEELQDLLREVVIHVFHGSLRQSADESVDAASFPDGIRIGEQVAQQLSGLLSAPALTQHAHGRGDERVADAEGGSRELIGHARVKVGVVVVAEACIQWPQAEEVHESGADEDRQELIEDDVLPLRIHNALALLNKFTKYVQYKLHTLLQLTNLIDLFIIPSPVESLHFRGDAIMLPDEEQVQDGQVGLLITPAVA